MDNTRLFGTEDIDEVQRIWEDMSWSRFDRSSRDSKTSVYQEECEEIYCEDEDCEICNRFYEDFAQ